MYEDWKVLIIEKKICSIIQISYYRKSTCNIIGIEIFISKIESKSSILCYFILIENSKIFSTFDINEINILERELELGPTKGGRVISSREKFFPPPLAKFQVRRDYAKIRRGGLLFVWKVRAVLLDIDDAL